MLPAMKRVISPASNGGASGNDDSYADTYFREIGFKTGENSLLGSTESPDLDGDEILDDLGRSLGLLEDNSLSTDVERAVAAAGNVSPPKNPSSNRRSSDAKAKPKAPLPRQLYTGISQSKTAIDTGKAKSPTDYAISYFKTGNDDYSISTLGEESIRRRQSPLNAEPQLAPKTKAVKKEKLVAPPPKPTELKKSRTRSTLKDRPSRDSDDNPAQATINKVSSSASSIDDEELRRKWRKIYFVMTFAIIILLAAAGVLAFSFLKLKNAEADDSLPSGFPDSATWVPGARETWTRSPTLSPDAAEPMKDAEELAREDFLQLISAISPDSLAAIGDTASPQYRAYDWLVSDPEYLYYPIERVIQRWSMAVLYFSTAGDMWDLPATNATFTDWLSSANECSWFSTDEWDICNDRGMIVAIALENMSLSGSIPPEISLLSSSLEFLDLGNNSINGTIPFEVGALSNLVRFQLSANDVEGTIPSEIGMLSSLEFLSLGRNMITGRLPEELGNLDRLSFLGLENNNLQGTIPLAFGQLSSLDYLGLQENNLQGFIPEELGLLEQLTQVTLHQNNLVGAMPIELCPANSTLEVLSADCMEVDCDCCTHCCVLCDGKQGIIVQMEPSGTPITGDVPTFSDEAFLNITESNVTNVEEDKEDASPTVAPTDGGEQDSSPTGAPTDGDLPAVGDVDFVNGTETNETNTEDLEDIGDVDFVNGTETNETNTEDLVDIAPSVAPIEEKNETIIVEDSDNSTETNDTEGFYDVTPTIEEPDLKETLAPSTAPTGLFDALRPIIGSNSSDCVSNVTTQQTCFDPSKSDIAVDFFNCNPTGNDWIGIFDKSSNFTLEVGGVSPNWVESELWVRACGDRQCSRRKEEGSVVLGDDRVKATEGEYQLVLVRRLIVIASIDTITVGSCD